MKYYHRIYLSQSFGDGFTYFHPSPIGTGVRVVVSFNRKEQFGICGGLEDDQTKIPKGVKPILEVLDETSLLTPDLFRLATWISAYYHTPMGKVLFAMLPAFLLPELDSSVTWVGSSDDIAEPFNKLYSALKDRQWKQISELKKDLDLVPLYKIIEEAEAMCLIQRKRKLKDRQKPKVQNYVLVLALPDVDLTPKQRAAYEYIQSQSEPIPLSRIADEISYSIIKALVKKSCILLEQRIVPEVSDLIPAISDERNIVLNLDQYTAVKEISNTKEYRHLLYGITGSGKTEVYIELIKETLNHNQGVIFLIPEIALTPQMVSRFVAAFGNDLAIMHSGLTDRQRYIEWKKVADGKSRIVIGARSAIFVPMPDLGLIIVDEEHEQSYKQDQSPRYHGRDLAVVRAMYSKAKVVLGSATPSLESWYNASLKKYSLSILMNRPADYQLPSVELINMRDEENEDILSLYLRDMILQTLDAKQQVLLFHNRRGFSSFVQCLKCGDLIKCPDCEISMYYHRDREELQCHYCGYSTPLPRYCPKCGSYSFAYGAPGTQKIEQLLRIWFPSAKILRMDSDSAAKKDTYRYMFEKMRNREVDILLGTQMISKGLDFHGITLVGVVSADISLNVPDFRASERTFQLLTQVAGRSGRGKDPGRVIIQTYNPDHYAIKHATRQDYQSFATEELSYRKRLCYPPYYRLSRLLFQATDKELLIIYMGKIQKELTSLLKSFGPDDLIALGPVPAPNVRINKFYRYHCILKAASAEIMSQALTLIMSKLKPPSAIGIFVDVDPISLL